MLRTLANGEAVKPVRTSGEAVAVPLPAASANVPTTITLQYRLQHNAWAAKGELDVPPVRFASGVPVLETEWPLHTPTPFSCLLSTSPSPRARPRSRMPSFA